MKAQVSANKIRTFALLVLGGAVSTHLAYADINASLSSIDPSSRVMQLNYFDGAVTFAPAGSDEWAYAYLNRPLTTGDRMWVDEKSRSELHVGSTAVRLGNQTSLQILDLDDDNIQLQVTQGDVSVHVRTLSETQSIEIDTPNLAFTIQSSGEYRITVDPRANISMVTVREGNGVAHGADNASFTVNAQQQVQFSGDNLTHVAAVDSPPFDAFDRWIADRDHRENASKSVSYVSRELTGYEELDAYGTWYEEPDFGAVWVPRDMAQDRHWAPYHNGSWAWIAPWGWTWIDDAPWGFAPFHYGRWAWIRNSWAWVPGPMDSHPIYAPALVAFMGNEGVSTSISLLVGPPTVAWFPLAPGEPYQPIYYTSQRYMANININTNRINNSTKMVYINQRAPNAITVIPATTFVRGQSVQRSTLQIAPGQLSQIHVITMPALAPIRQSIIGNAVPAKVLPPTASFDRRVIAMRAASEPPARHDALAQKLSKENGIITRKEPSAFDHTRYLSLPHLFVIGHQKKLLKPTSPKSLKMEENHGVIHVGHAISHLPESSVHVPVERIKGDLQSVPIPQRGHLIPRSPIIESTERVLPAPMHPMPMNTREETHFHPIIPSHHESPADEHRKINLPHIEQELKGQPSKYPEAPMYHSDNVIKEHALHSEHEKHD